MPELPIPALSTLLRDYNFTYFPWTDWRSFFRPAFYFGCNVSDADTEREVLDSVGSYGSQINRLLDAVNVLIKIHESPDTALTSDEQLALGLLKKLAKEADAASTRAEQRR